MAAVRGDSSETMPKRIPASGLPAEHMVLGRILAFSHVSARRLASHSRYLYAEIYLRGEDRTPFDASKCLGTRIISARLAGGVNVVFE
jgi:hypothetical protein